MHSPDHQDHNDHQDHKTITASGEIARDLRNIARHVPDVVQYQVRDGAERYHVPGTFELPAAEFTVMPNGEFTWFKGNESKLFEMLLEHLGERCGVHATYDLTQTSLPQEAFSMTLSTPDGDVRVKAQRPLQVLVHVLLGSVLAGRAAELAAEFGDEDDILLMEDAGDDLDEDLLIID